ncbi:MAG: hypothetical protein N2114_00275, partial [Candidatus Goldbacteria bacterium]|nr:hypothetical protein [Candidatus Goldiibacteriota bacterium]
ANPVGDIAQIIKNHKIGLTVKYYAEDVAEKTIFLLNRPHLIKKFGFNARKTAEKYFDWKILAEKLNEIYKSVNSKNY